MALHSASLAARQGVGRARTARASAPAKRARSPLPRRAARRWLTAAMLFVAAALAVAYIANAIAVNGLVAEIASIDRERDEVRAENERLRGELLRMMSVERVTAQAGRQLGLISPERPPIALTPSAGATNQPAKVERGDDAAGR
jgi:hypothetical protein